MLNFNYQVLTVRVLFGNGRLSEVQTEAIGLNGARALVLATEFQVDLARHVCMLLGDMCAGIHPKAIQHVPYDTIVAALDEVNRLNIDLLVAPGGGSTIGLAKGIALETGLPILAIPTTYAGSEMTHIWGISRDGRKITGRDSIVKPKTVIYDPELLLTLPPKLSLTSGINAMAHAVEALYAENANPVASMIAEESIRQLARNLPDVVNNPADVNARDSSLHGAWLAGSVLDMVGMALHHKLCHTLGGSFDMPHAETHTVILPYAVHFNAPAIPNAVAAMARALDCQSGDVAGVIQDISRENGGPISLQELGFLEGDLDKAADIATRDPYYNPRPVTKETIRDLLEQAFHGKRPS